MNLTQFSSVQSLSRVRLFVTPWTAARQASLPITNSQSLPKLMSIESVMPSNYLILCRPLLLPPLILLWLRLFILSGVISPLISSSMLGNYQPGEFIFQCHTFLPFHTVHGVLKIRILKLFAIPFSSGPHFVRILHHDPSILGGPTRHGS